LPKPIRKWGKAAEKLSSSPLARGSKSSYPRLIEL
jgi:hypothetical protein